MRKLIESTLVSLDGVIESPERWAIFDEESHRRSAQELDDCDAFVMGRVTYERFRDSAAASSGNAHLDQIKRDAQIRRLAVPQRSDVERHPPRP